jgi:plasmid stabilization system protein ParE
MEIIWSPEAQNDYWNNIQYLLEEFSVEVAQDFIEKVDQYINTISNNPKAFQTVNYKNIRFVPVVPKISLYYRVAKNQIEILRFFNNLQDPKQKNLK